MTRGDCSESPRLCMAEHKLVLGASRQVQCCTCTRANKATRRFSPAHRSVFAQPLAQSWPQHADRATARAVGESLAQQPLPQSGSPQPLAQSTSSPQQQQLWQPHAQSLALQHQLAISVLASDVPDVPGTSSRTPGDVWKSAFWVFFGWRGRHRDA
jgi:hypothetical protein